MRTVWWVLALASWLLSAIGGWMLMTTLFMFGGLENARPQAQLLLWAPVIALALCSAAAIMWRKARWLPATLLLSPALQVVGLVWARLDPII